MKQWLSAWQGFLGLFLESPCPLCQRSTPHAFCRSCQQRLAECQVQDPLASWQGDLPIFAWGTYAGSLKRALTVLKYENQPQLALPLGNWLAQAWIQAGCGQASDLLAMPIPLHTAKLQQRGFNQAELIAESFCQQTGIPLKRRGLGRARATTAQFGLSAHQRQENLVDAFHLGPDGSQVGRRRVLLVDDIYTTGATVRSATQVLQAHHIVVAGVITVARTPDWR